MRERLACLLLLLWQCIMTTYCPDHSYCLSLWGAVIIHFKSVLYLCQCKKRLPHSWNQWEPGMGSSLSLSFSSFCIFGSTSAVPKAEELVWPYDAVFAVCTHRQKKRLMARTQFSWLFKLNVLYVIAIYFTLSFPHFFPVLVRCSKWKVTTVSITLLT